MKFNSYWISVYVRSANRVMTGLKTWNSSIKTNSRLCHPPDTYKLLLYLDLTQNPKIGQEAVVDNNFVAHTVGDVKVRVRSPSHRQVISFDRLPDAMLSSDRRLHSVTRMTIFFWYRQINCSNIREIHSLSLEAVAAYQRNNFIRDRVLLRIPIRNDITFSPTFFKIKITAKLNDAVMGGFFAADSVAVYRHTPQLPRRNSEGMRPLENRATIL